MGIEGYAQIAALAGEKDDAKKYHKIAADMASDWEKRAKADDHYQLVFGEGQKDTWSLKYNLIWDKLWKSGLFSDEVYEKELAYYKKKANRYGTPLDSRAAYTKSDWILWCAAMDNTAALIQPVAAYLKETTTRVPFSDWYQTDSGMYCYFIARSVQGGIFMPMLAEQIK